MFHDFLFYIEWVFYYDEISHVNNRLTKNDEIVNFIFDLQSVGLTRIVNALAPEIEAESLPESDQRFIKFAVIEIINSKL